MRWWPVGLVLGALLIVGLTSMMVGEISGEFNSEVGDFSGLGPPIVPLNQDEKKETEGVFLYRHSSFDTNLWVSLAGGLFVAVLAGTILAILYAIIKSLIKQRDPRRPSVHRGPPVEEMEVHPEAVRTSVRAALQELDEGDDPRKAVIACWLRLEHEAAGAGVPRLVGDTPGELVARLLADHDEEALRQLMGAYHLARYAPHEVSEELRSTARQALHRLHASRNLVETRHE
ncbi:DUF4129 domain-containing protein [Nonomuraea sp. NPDC050663]|uniref:DUF4129 domain-containing protein n=1 Tax=Nonomuraea sp. NPDC050663 TaxID=3364370 RepID=UPI00378DFE71